jgi:transposase
VKLTRLPPYSPDLNPIEEVFAELKGFLRHSCSNRNISLTLMTLALLLMTLWSVIDL